MGTVAWVMSALSVTVVLLQACNLYRQSNGRVSHVLTFSVYSGYLIVELWLALRDPAQVAVLLFVGLNLWGMGTAVRGWRKERASN